MARNYTLQSATPARPHSGINYAAELNAQQYAAVTSPPGPTLVIAGAGSGKTRTLTYRVAYLLDNGIPPAHILLLTFTNKAAHEMLDRVRRLVGVDTQELWGGTFHSVGNRVLRAHADTLGWARNFTIMDREDQKDLMLSVYQDCGIDPKAGRFPKPEVVADVLSLSQNTTASLEDTLETRYSYLAHHQEAIARIGEEYERRKQKTNCFDFDDLLVKTVRLLEDHPGIADSYQRRFEFVLVDEYQDTNAIQGEMIDLFAAHHKNLMVVGDDAQSIYSWRGADFRNILDFSTRYPGAHVHKIETNYRSVPQILQLANASILRNEHQFRKELAPARPEAAALPALVPLQDVNMQASFIAQRLQELHDEEGLEWSAMAVLYRAHFHSMEIQMELTRRSIPFTVTSGLRFFEQAHVKDVASFMRFAANRRDEVAFHRMLKLLPGIGAKTATKIWDRWLLSDAAGAPIVPCFSEILLTLPVPAKSREAWEQMAYTLDELMTEAGEPKPPAEMMTSIVEGVYREYAEKSFPNAMNRLEDLEHLHSFSRGFTDIGEFLSQLSLLAGQDAAGAGGAVREEQSVCLSTVHQAKGLEWQAVFVVWLAEGMFPNKRVIENDEDGTGLEEERRLFYVAVTRAEDQLFLTYPLWWGGSWSGIGTQEPSRFLEELPENAVEVWNVGAVRGRSPF